MKFDHFNHVMNFSSFDGIDFYEEAFSLLYDLTSKTISPDMWVMLGIVYKVFKESAFDCFLDLMPALHNYITIDTEAFLADENRVGIIFDMCKTVSKPKLKRNLNSILVS